MRLFLYLLFLTSALNLAEDSLKVSDKLASINHGNFFKEEGYATWAGHIVKENGLYYLIYSRWKTVGGDWRTNSGGGDYQVR